MNNGSQQPAFIDLNAPMDGAILTAALRFLCRERMDSLLGFALTFEQDCEVVWMLHEHGGNRQLHGHAITWDDEECEWMVVSMSEANCAMRGFYSCPTCLLDYSPLAEPQSAHWRKAVRQHQRIHPTPFRDEGEFELLRRVGIYYANCLENRRFAARQVRHNIDRLCAPRTVQAQMAA